MMQNSNNNVISSTDELVDIVNKHDEVISTMWRSQSKGQRYMRCAIAILINNDNKFCVFRKPAHKAPWASHVGFVAGGVQSGESYEQGMRREAMEEANLDMHAYSWRPLGVITPHDTEYQEAHKKYYDSNFFKMIFEIRVDHQEINVNPHDFDAYFWLDVHEIYHGNPSHTFFPDLPWLIKHFYPHLLTKK